MIDFDSIDEWAPNLADALFDVVSEESRNTLARISHQAGAKRFGFEAVEMA